jgi:hypothetical protein
MHDRIFANQRQLGRDDLLRHAKAILLDVPAFERCLEAQAIEADQKAHRTSNQVAA